MSIEKLIEANTAALLTLANTIAGMAQPTGKVPEAAKSIFDEEAKAEAPAKKQGKASAKSTESSATSGSKPTTVEDQPAQSVPDVAALRKELTEVVVSVAKMDAEGVTATRAILNGDYGVKKASEVPDAKVAECLAKFKAAKAKLEGGAQEPDEEDFT